MFVKSQKILHLISDRIEKLFSFRKKNRWIHLWLKHALQLYPGIKILKEIVLAQKTQKVLPYEKREDDYFRQNNY